jgi:hypothetical protein
VVHLRKKRVLVWKLEGKRPLRRTTARSSRRETNVKVGRKKLGWDGVDWIYLAPDREKWLAVMRLLMNLHVPHYAVNVLSIEVNRTYINAQTSLFSGACHNSKVKRC